MVQKPRSDSSESQTNRRKFLQLGTAAITATTFGSAAIGLTEASSTNTYKIREGTPDETEVVIIDSGSPGPTAVIVGGMHGNEPAGYKAPQKMRNWSIDEGKLVLIPKSDPVAIKRDTYSNDRGNLNRQFPPGKDPKTPLARAIWKVITDHDADLVFNLHSSKGIYKSDVGPDGVGQAIYPTTADGAKEDATKAAAYMNRNYLGDSRADYYRFKRGNMIRGTRPLLIHKVDADLHIPGFIVETTRYKTDLDTRINWTLHIVQYILSRHSIDRVSGETPNNNSSGEDSSGDNSSDNSSGDNSSDGSSGDDSSDGSAGNGSSDESSDNKSSTDRSSQQRDQIEVLTEQLRNADTSSEKGRLISQFFN